jgi:hypothetical protein
MTAPARLRIRAAMNGGWTRGKNSDVLQENPDVIRA